MDDFMFLTVNLLKQQSIAEIKQSNDYTLKYGLTLSDHDINALVEHRKEALELSGRIEFSGGVIQKLIYKFASSPYVYQDNYVSTMSELQELFYYFKNETMDEINDDDLIHIMKQYFDLDCQGSLKSLQTRVFENICRLRASDSLTRDSLLLLVRDSE